MSNPFKIVSRTDIGLDPVVRSSSGAPRPKLFGEPWATIHQTGVNVSYAGKDTAQQIRNIETWAAGQGKPNEYNYVIGQQADDKIHEYAGPFQAAHSGGENSESVGVLLLNGNNEPVTDLQIEKFRYLIYGLQVFGVISGNVIILPHYQMPGANTSCPKQVMGNRLGEFRVPWQVKPTPPPPPPPPPPTKPPVVTPTVLQTVAISGDGWWSLARRVYGNTNVAAHAQALERANGGIALKPGTVISVPGRAVI